MSYITLKDLARILQVSESTVSRALRDHPRISKATRERVQRLAEQLDYTPNQIALELSQRRMQAVGVVVPSIGYHLYARAISGMEQVLNENGFNLIICQSNESYEREKSMLRDLTGSRIAGLIISLSSSTRHYDHFARIKSRKVPLVFFNRECRDIQTDRVIIDNFGAAKSATQHLIDSGCKRLVFLGGPGNVQISNRRREGFHQAIAESGRTIDGQIAATEFNTEAAYRVALKLLKQPCTPDGVLAFSDQIAYQVLLAAKHCHIRVPDQLSVIGFNNEPAGALLDPPLSSVDQPAFEMGTLAAELLLRQILDPKSPYRTQTRLLQSELILRGTTR